MSLDSSSAFGASVDECVRLFMANRSNSTVETIMRVRALQEVTGDMDTADLLMLLSAVQKAKSAQRLSEALIDYIDNGPHHRTANENHRQAG